MGNPPTNTKRSERRRQHIREYFWKPGAVAELAGQRKSLPDFGF